MVRIHGIPVILNKKSKMSVNMDKFGGIPL